jgi:hypothetical protein
MTFEEYLALEHQNAESLSARTHNKSVQARSKKKKLPKKPVIKDLREGTPKNLHNPKLFDLLYNNKNKDI